MKVSELGAQAWTPELKGKFGNFQLLIRPFLTGERKRKGKELVGKMGFKLEGQGIAVSNIPGEVMAGFNNDVMGLVIDWKNLTYAETGKPVPCTDETKKTYLENLQDVPTGIEKPRPEGNGNSTEKLVYYTLYEYIDFFSGQMEHFEKNSPTTV